MSTSPSTPGGSPCSSCHPLSSSGRNVPSQPTLPSDFGSVAVATSSGSFWEVFPRQRPSTWGENIWKAGLCWSSRPDMASSPREIQGTAGARERLGLSSDVVSLWLPSNVLQSFLFVTLLLCTADRYGQCAKTRNAMVNVISRV